MKNIIIVLALFCVSLPVLSDELLYNTTGINMTPQSAFSGYKSNDLRSKYPHLNSNNYYSTSYEQQRSQIMRAKSVKDVSNYENYNNSKSSLEEFSRRMDDNDMMRINGLQNGIQNMFMNF